MYDEPNPLAVHDLRELKHKAPHLEEIAFQLKCNEKNIVNWLYENTVGRFFVETKPIDGRMSMIVAFENHSESSFFALQLDMINKD